MINGLRAKREGGSDKLGDTKFTCHQFPSVEKEGGQNPGSSQGLSRRAEGIQASAQGRVLGAGKLDNRFSEGEQVKSLGQWRVGGRQQVASVEQERLGAWNGWRGERINCCCKLQRARIRGSGQQSPPPGRKKASWAMAHWEIGLKKGSWALGHWENGSKKASWALGHWENGLKKASWAMAHWKTGRRKRVGRWRTGKTSRRKRVGRWRSGKTG